METPEDESLAFVIPTSLFADRLCDQKDSEERGVSVRLTS